MIPQRCKGRIGPTMLMLLWLVAAGSMYVILTGEIRDGFVRYAEMTGLELAEFHILVHLPVLSGFTIPVSEAGWATWLLLLGLPVAGLLLIWIRRDPAAIRWSVIYLFLAEASVFAWLVGVVVLGFLLAYLKAQ